MHIITITQNSAGLFDVLLNGVSYRIHRNLSERDARIRAADVMRSFQQQGHRAVIE